PSTPPQINHRQQHALPRFTTGRADSTPIKSPPRTAGWLIVVLPSEMRNQLLTLHVAQRVLELHQLNKQIVFRVYLGGMHRALEVEREPLLNARHPRALGKIEQQHRIEHNGRCQNAIAAEEVDLQLHR